MTPESQEGFPAEMLDHYIRLQQGANDGRMRAVVELGGHLDLARFTAAVRVSLEHVPILGCAWAEVGGKARWVPACWSDHELVRVVPDGGELIDSLRAATGARGPQILAQVLLRPGRNVIVLTVNHMAFDGAGLKEYLYLLSGLYSGSSPEVARGGTRSLSALLAGIPFRRRLACMLRRSLVVGGGGPLAIDGEARATRLALLRIEPEVLGRVRAFCRTLGITINDLVMALLCRAMAAREPGRRTVTLQTMVDLRRYAPARPISPFGNFSSMETLTVPGGDRDLRSLAADIGERMRRIKAGLPGVRNVQLMAAAWRLLPRARFDAGLRGRIRTLGVSASNAGVLDRTRLRFDGLEPADAFLLASIKEQPALQLTFSTFADRITLGFLGNYSAQAWAVVEALVGGMAEDLAALPAETADPESAEQNGLHGERVGAGRPSG
jgi:NRPS condensation-like uncharacterized protein